MRSPSHNQGAFIMSILTDNISFAILKCPATWRSDLTHRYIEYHSRKFNGDLYRKRVHFAESVDEALNECKTDYLIVQSAGHIIFDEKFFDSIETAFSLVNDIFIGEIIIAEDYARLGENCLVFNVSLWDKCGRPAFSSSMRVGPTFAQPPIDKHKYSPLQLKKIGADTAAIPPGCALFGGGLIARQLQQFNRVQSIKSCFDPSSYFFLDRSTPAAEILCETYFEKRYLPRVKKHVSLVDTDTYDEIESLSFDTIVVPARGLKAYNLSKMTGAKKIIIYDSNTLALAFQRILFSSPATRIYGEIIDTFRNKFPSTEIVEDYSADEYSVIQIPSDLEVQYFHTDLFSFEGRELIGSVNPGVSALFDFSTIFSTPHNFYRRPLPQVLGLFSEIYGLIKSRTGASRIIGEAPGFKNMSSIKVNTFVYEVEDYMVDELSEQGEVVAQRVAQRARREAFKPEEQESISEEEIVIQDLAEEQETIAEKIHDALYELNKHLTGKGYDVSTVDEKIKFTKVEVFTDYAADFTYQYDCVADKWSFLVNKCGRSNMVEFANGAGLNTLIDHINLHQKINPKSAGKLL